jgi:hypothetical protein
MPEQSALDTEIETAFATVDAMVEAYLGLTDRRKVGEVQNMLYDDLLDFANFRVETALSAVMLARNERVSDALGLCRSLLEHVLLLRLQCRGNRYFEIEAPQRRSEGEFKAALVSARANLAELHTKGEAMHCVAVERYPRGRRQLMWIYRGLSTSDGDDESLVSIHYFHFQDFRPDTMRLDDDKYLNYLSKDWPGAKELRASKRRHQDEAKFRYLHYLSWPGLVTCLAINNLATEAEILRIEAHYTFLGQYLHPTHRAARDLHEKANFHNGRAAVGMDSPYTRVSVLLAALYVVWLLRSILEEISDMLDNAPLKYISHSGTGPMRELIDSIPNRYGYFWFISNEAPLWDRYNHAVHQATDEELEASGGYAGLATGEIPFDPNIYEHLKQALGAWDNTRVGKYASPLVT